MADPARPVQDAWIDPVWGQWVHDRQVGTAPQLIVRQTVDHPPAWDDTWSAVQFNVVELDVGSRWNAAAKGWVAPRAGYIEVSAGCRMVSNTAATAPTQLFAASVWRNTSEAGRIGHQQGTGLLSSAFAGNPIFLVAVNDMISVQTYFGSFAGATKTVQTGGWMSIRYLT